MSLITCLAIIALASFPLLAQDVGIPITGTERLTFIGALVIAVGVQYRENRQKDAFMRDAMIKVAESNERVELTLERIARAMESAGQAKGHAAGS